ncbi:hypothetical protein CYJ36_07430 [Bacillus sp. UMB0893]|nr:hypothetical protein CYJ36_07430 [Bacillus sp. UMB0893]
MIVVLVIHCTRGFTLQALAFRGEGWEPLFPQESSAFRFNPLKVLTIFSKSNKLYEKSLMLRYLIYIIMNSERNNNPYQIKSSRKTEGLNMSKQSIELSKSLEENMAMIKAKLGDSSDIRFKDIVNQG